MNRIWLRTVIRISLLALALVMVFFTMRTLSNPQNVEKNGFFQLFLGP